MRVMITGTNEIKDHNLIINSLNQFKEKVPITEIVTSQSSGVDSIAELWAGDLGFPVVPIHSEWNDLTQFPCEVRIGRYKNKYNALAPYARNLRIAGYIDLLLVFYWGYASDELQDLIKQCVLKNVKVLKLTVKPKINRSVIMIDNKVKIYTGYFSKINTYKTAGLFPISISTGIPQDMSDDIPKYLKLAPTKEILGEFKYGDHKDDKNWYLRKYVKDVLSKVTPEEVYADLMNFSGTTNPVLLCWEGLNKFCHRHIVAEWFKQNGYQIEEYNL